MHLILTFVYCNKRYYNEINKTMYLVVTSISISMSISIFIYYIYYKSWIPKTKGCKLRWQCLFLKLHNNYMCQHIYLLSFEFKFRRKKIHHKYTQLWGSIEIPNWYLLWLQGFTPNHRFEKGNLWFIVKYFANPKKQKKEKTFTEASLLKLREKILTYVLFH